MLFTFYLLINNVVNRIQLQDLVRRNSSPEDQEKIDIKREDLVAMFAQLKDLQISAGVTENTTNEHPVLDNEKEYDEYEEDSTEQTVADIIPIERKQSSSLQMEMSQLMFLTLKSNSG